MQEASVADWVQRETLQVVQTFDLPQQFYLKVQSNFHIQSEMKADMRAACKFIDIHSVRRKYSCSFTNT